MRHTVLTVVMAVVMMCSTMAGSVVMAINPQPEPPGTSVSVWIDDKQLVLEIDPVIESGRTLVPMRAIFEELGAKVNWDGVTQKVTAQKVDITLILQIGNNTAYKNGTAIQLDVPPGLYDGSTMVPMRFVGEAMGAAVDWDGDNRKVNIKSNASLDSKTSLLPTTKVVRVKPQPGANLDLASTDIRDNKGINFDLESDYDAIQKAINIARPIKTSEIPTYIPSKMDFSPYVTFVGSQDGWGGCIGRSIVQVMNILNERENPYTPDLSFWYLHARQMQLFNGDPDPDTKFQLESEGLCSEASLPTDYDPYNVVNGEGDWSDMQWPNAGNYIEGKSLYRVTFPDEPITPDVDTVKSLMAKYGPLLAGGPFHIIQGENPAEWHCITIIGYNDDTSEFSCLNSWGDQKHGGDGIFELAYDQLEENVGWIRYIEDLPSHRELTSHAYTGRINLDGQWAYRNKVTVKIGVEGQESVTIWDTPNQVQCNDSSYDLCLDFALPLYADECWPPATNQRWYIEINNDNYVEITPDWSDGIFTLKEFTLARLYKKDNGSLDTETFSAASSVGQVIKDGVTRIYIPSVTKTIVKPDIELDIKLPPIVIKPLLPILKTQS